MKSVSRRMVLGSAAVGTIAAAASVSWLFLSNSSQSPLSEDLARVFELYRPHAVSVGERYLQCTPHEADAAVLTSLLNIDEALVPHEPDALVDFVRERIRRDFAEGRTADVDGWVLSVTEARLCAMTALAARADA